MAYIRTKEGSKYEEGYLRVFGKPSLKGHRHWIESYLDEIGYQIPNSDGIIPFLNWDRQFELVKSSFEAGTPDWDHDVICFTDGSKDDAGNTGSGLAIYNKDKDVVSEDSWYLGKFSTVYQSEVYAIKKAADKLLYEGCTNRKIVIHSDSRASLLALNSNEIKAQSVHNTVIVLNELSRSNTVQLRWVKAHVNHDGNENADRLAKLGARRTDDLAGDVPLISSSSIRADVCEAISAQWQKYWDEDCPCRQTKMFYPKIKKIKKGNITLLNRKTLSIVVQLFTGHNHLNRHETIIQHKWPDMQYADCRYCKLDEESSFHVFAQCDKFADARREFFGSDVLTAPFQWNSRTLTGFLKEAIIDTLLIDN